jgi:lipopolysaccharide/colanic/teichoic acid biosynthesis glycosyltransferase
MHEVQEIQSQPRSLAHGVGKRALDIVFSGLVILLTAPVLAAAVVLIRLETPGAAVFRQTRMGRDGRPFQLYKLRGMFIDAEQRFPHLYKYTATHGDASDFYYHAKTDPRITRVGRVLRRFSIDELPNFVNVIRGDMSVVGPRPEIPELAHMYGDWLGGMLSVRPGVTSPAKASGRDKLSLAEIMALDQYYVENQSLRLDLQVIARTVASALRGKNAS